MHITQHSSPISKQRTWDSLLGIAVRLLDEIIEIVLDTPSSRAKNSLDL